AAARTALGAVAASTLFSIDRDDNGGWGISLVSADGTEDGVDVAPDGASITRGPVVDNDDDTNDTNDRAERLRLLDARVDYVAALRAARGAVAAGTVNSVDLDEDNGATTWDVQVGENTATEQTVVVDAASGDVLRTEQDD
ncbi:MAG: hypothetical protein H7233_11940, partial [Pseudorhodobacter sp.]|nr:hypothetical protein [Frankiaceae bacterium]